MGDKPKQTRQRVSEKTVKKVLTRSGKKIHTVTETLQELTGQKNIKFDIPELTKEVRGNYKVVRK